jgi:hypothetical protein
MSQLTRSYAASDLEVLPDHFPRSMRVNTQKRTADDAASESDTEIICTPPRPKRIRPSTKKKAAQTEAPNVGMPEPVSGDEGPKTITVRGKALPRRPPQPGRTNRNNHPGMIVASRPKRTREEVAAVAKRKADLQQEVEEAERKRVDAIARMELQDEDDEEARERSIIRKWAGPSGPDDPEAYPEDVEMQSGDEENASADKTDSASSDSDSVDDKAVAEDSEKVAPKRKQVMLFYVQNITSTITDAMQNATAKEKTPERGDTSGCGQSKGGSEIWRQEGHRSQASGVKVRLIK